MPAMTAINRPTTRLGGVSLSRHVHHIEPAIQAGRLVAQARRHRSVHARLARGRLEASLSLSAGQWPPVWSRGPPVFSRDIASSGYAVYVSQPIHILARHRAKPDTIDEVRQILLSLIELSRAEPGCLKYELLQNAEDPTDFTFVETFANDQALKEHATAPYIAGLAAKLGGLVARPAEVARYHAIAEDPRPRR